jgi:hypothetical protein
LLDIYSPDVVDLTLVDLPGAVRIAADGQDPSVKGCVHASRNASRDKTLLFVSEATRKCSSSRVNFFFPLGFCRVVHQVSAATDRSLSLSLSLPLLFARSAPE